MEDRSPASNGQQYPGSCDKSLSPVYSTPELSFTLTFDPMISVKKEDGSDPSFVPFSMVGGYLGSMVDFGRLGEQYHVDVGMDGVNHRR